MRYSDDEGDGMGNHDDLDDLEGGTGMQTNMHQMPWISGCNEGPVPTPVPWQPHAERSGHVSSLQPLLNPL